MIWDGRKICGWQNDLRMAERSGDGTRIWEWQNDLGMTEHLAEVQSLLTTVSTWCLPCEVRRIWKCPWPRVHWAVSEVSGALCALLTKSQSVEEIPGITSWGTALTHPPKPQSGQRDIHSCDVPHHCRGGGPALLIPGNPSLTQLHGHRITGCASGCSSWNPHTEGFSSSLSSGSIKQLHSSFPPLYS